MPSLLIKALVIQLGTSPFMDASQQFDDHGIRHKCEKCGQSYLARYLAGTSKLPPEWETCPWCRGDKSPYKIEGVKVPLWLAFPVMVTMILLMVGLAVAAFTLRLHSPMLRTLFTAVMLGFAAVMSWRLFQMIRFLRRVK